ncbi:MAG: LptE family protein, partial [Planctomycetota bacterium]
MRRLAVTLALAALSACAGAKGWKAGSTLPTKYRSIAVPIFQNATYDRQIGYQLTEALQKRLQQVSPYAIAGEGGADTVLRGKVTKVDIRQISQSLGTGLSEEVGYTVTVDWEWVDMRTGKPIAAQNGFASSGMVVASRPQAEPLDLAKYGAVQHLAEDIVA